MSVCLLSIFIISKTMGMGELHSTLQHREYNCVQDALSMRITHVSTILLNILYMRVCRYMCLCFVCFFAAEDVCDFLTGLAGSVLLVCAAAVLLCGRSAICNFGIYCFPHVCGARARVRTVQLPQI